jgi:hypothetical protein
LSNSNGSVSWRHCEHQKPDGCCNAVLKLKFRTLKCWKPALLEPNLHVQFSKVCHPDKCCHIVPFSDLMERSSSSPLQGPHPFRVHLQSYWQLPKGRAAPIHQSDGEFYPAVSLSHCFTSNCYWGHVKHVVESYTYPWFRRSSRRWCAASSVH